MAKITFKINNPQQDLLLPPSLDELIPVNHPVRIVNHVIDKIDIADILHQYKGGGCSSFHPRMMLKVIIYAYLCNVYSSRQIARQLRENIYYMWLSGYSKPDHRTINNFRSKRLQGNIENIFKQVVELLAAEGLVSLKTVYIDGTKIESKSNRYRVVWRKNVERHSKNLKIKIASIIEEIGNVIKMEEEENLSEESITEMTSEELKGCIDRIAQKLNEQNKEEKKKCKTIKEKMLPKLSEYEEQHEKLGNRNSYSKTDEDATFMRSKEDIMQTGELKPMYNVQIGTENQFITLYDIGQKAGDTTLLLPFYEKWKNTYRHYPEEAIADAGYGSEQNYGYMLENQILPYVKYNTYEQEKTKKFLDNIYHSYNLAYHKEGNYVTCPIGKKMKFKGERKYVSDMGYKSSSSMYEGIDCGECPLKEKCYNGKYNRVVEINHKLIKYRQIAKMHLNSEIGKYHQKKRSIEPEAVFGQLKWNKGFRRFRLTGLSGVSNEFGLLALAHNLKKYAKIKALLPYFDFFSPYFHCLPIHVFFMPEKYFNQRILA
jgi:transposase